LLIRKAHNRAIAVGYESLQGDSDSRGEFYGLCKSVMASNGRVSRFRWSIHRLNQISRQWIIIRTKRTTNKIINKEFWFSYSIRWC
jgi:hypothetical protein